MGGGRTGQSLGQSVQGVRFFERVAGKEGIEMPLAIYREEIYPDTELVALDLQKFWRFR